MKTNYEDITRYYLPKRTFTIVRVDGKAFHTYTRGMDKPFDLKLIEAMQSTAKYLCEEVQGCEFAYGQSDEISLVMTDFRNLNTSAYFDGNIQKTASVTASMASAMFNSYNLNGKLAAFDSRVFTIPQRSEVINYFVWRQRDAVRNSIIGVAQSLYSHGDHKELMNRNTDQMQEMIFQKGINWNDYPDSLKRGWVINKVYSVDSSWWSISGAPHFKHDEPFFEKLPDYE